MLSTLQRIEVISNAMELRGFGKKEKRTWIMARPFAARDYGALAFALAALGISIAFMVINGGRYFNPFV